jgi:hypothetical protein
MGWVESDDWNACIVPENIPWTVAGMPSLLSLPFRSVL